MSAFANLNAADVLRGIISSPATLEAVLTQGPMIVNDYVFTVEETDVMYIFTARRGSETQTIRLPKSGSSGVDFTTDETLILDQNKVLSVNTTDAAVENDMRPITAHGVYNEFSAINALLKTI